MITTDIQRAVQAAAAQAYGSLGLDFEIEPARPGFGDFTSNVAFTLAKSVGRPPREIAAELSAQIKLDQLERVEAAGAGFINFYLRRAYWGDVLDGIGERYGSCALGEGRKVQVEFISANPTGPTTIGNARGGFIGDVLSNVLDRCGFDVTREYYFNNAGTQISKLLESVKMEAGILPETQERQYRGSYIRELAEEFATELREKSDDELKDLLTGTILIRYIKPAVEKMGIEFDVWFNEQDLLKNGRFDETIRLLREKGLVFERDGAVWLKTGELGDERQERVIIKSNGDPTYMAPDIAYHADLFGRRGFDYAIKVLGPDHIAQFPSVYAAVHALYPDKQFTMASYQWLRVMRDGQEVKVSKRLGQFITVSDLIDEVTVPVARFLILMRSADSHMDFDLDLARETSAKNPYYYVMYSYARANSILRKAMERGLKPGKGMRPEMDLEVQIIKQMSLFPSLLKEIASDFGVHRLTFFGLELAKLFQDYYEQFRIIDLEQDEAEKKLYLIQQYARFMNEYFLILGIEPLERMEKASDY